MTFFYLYCVHGISMIVIHQYLMPEMWLIFRRNLIQFVLVEHGKCIFLILSDLDIYLCEGRTIIYFVVFGMSERRFAQNYWNKSFIARLALLCKLLSNTLVYANTILLDMPM